MKITQIKFGGINSIIYITINNSKKGRMSFFELKVATFSIIIHIHDQITRRKAENYRDVLTKRW